MRCMNSITPFCSSARFDLTRMHLLVTRGNRALELAPKQCHQALLDYAACSGTWN